MPAFRSGLLPKSQAPFLFLTEWYYLIKLLKTRSIDLINSHWMIPQGFTVALAKHFFPHIPHLLTIHSTDVHTLRRMPGGHSISRFITKSADGIVSVSHFVHNMLQNITSMDIDAHILPMGVNSKAFVPKVNKHALRRQKGIVSESVVLYVGKLIEVKGVQTLIEAMATVRNTCNAQLLIAGGGDLKPVLERQAQALGLADDISFLGPVAHEDLIDLYGLCDVVVVPSIVTARQETEGMPVVILEALSAGYPVVASDVGGIRDVVKDGINGYLVPPRDSEILADRISCVLTPETAQEMRIHAVESGHRYDWRRIGDEYHRIIEGILIASPVPHVP